MKLKQETAEKEAKALENVVYRMSSGSASNDQTDQKSKGDYLRYLRKGDHLPQDTIENVCREYAKKTFVGATNEELDMQTKTLVAGIDPQGGYWVRPELSNIMVKRIFETSPMRAISTVVSTSSDVLEMIIDDNELQDGGWVGETATRSDTNTPNIGKLSIPVHEIYAQPKASQKMLDDAGFDVESWLMRKVTDKVTRDENLAFVRGDGSQKPTGFLSYDAWTTNSTPTVAGIYERGKLERISTGVAATITADSLKLLQNSLLEDYQADAVFLLQRTTFEQVITLKDGIGHYLLNVDSMSKGDEKLLLGKKVIFANDMQAAAANSLSVAYGDFKTGYTIVDRFGFRVLRDMYTAKPYVKFYTTKRTGGAVTNYQCIKVLKLG
jgi:HK97 family phage major capsid protein